MAIMNITSGAVCGTVAMILLGGCSESVLIRSYPAGAKVYVNDDFIGVAPSVYTTKHSQIGKSHRVRLERNGYEPREDLLRTGICGGRIAGGIFTLGIVLLIRGPTCFVSPQDFSLEALPQSAGGRSGSDAMVEERLQRLERMRNEGRITNEEYDEYRKQILRGI
jgi:hypothetical protein